MKSQKFAEDSYDSGKRTAENVEIWASRDNSVSLQNEAVLLDESAVIAKQTHESELRAQIREELRKEIEAELRSKIEAELREEFEQNKRAQQEAELRSKTEAEKQEEAERNKRAQAKAENPQDFEINDGKLVKYKGRGGDVIIPDSVKIIGNDAFRNCVNLTSVTFPSALTSIGESAFWDCKSLKSITIPDSVTSIGRWAFSGCESLMSITADVNNKVYHSDGNCLIQTLSKTLAVGCNNSVIPSDGSVTSIGQAAFGGCSNLESITIPYSVTSIGSAAFNRCINLKSITVDKNNKVFYSVNNCVIESNTKTLVVGCQSSVIPPDGSVTSIGGYAFYGHTNLTSITIPDSVKKLESHALAYCGNLRTIIFKGTKAQWNAVVKEGSWNYFSTNYKVKCND